VSGRRAPLIAIFGTNGTYPGSLAISENGTSNRLTIPDPTGIYGPESVVEHFRLADGFTLDLTTYSSWISASGNYTASSRHPDYYRFVIRQQSEGRRRQ
jgi:hypothetical protein